MNEITREDEAVSPAADVDNMPEEMPATTFPTENLSALPPAPQEDEAEPAATPPPEAARLRYWHEVLTGNPDTVPQDVRERAGANAAGLSPEQQDYALFSAINRSWVVDHRGKNRSEVLAEWKTHRSALAQELVVATKTACTAIKAALISTGIGALVWLLGEGLSAVVGLFMDAEGEAEAAAAATRHFADELKALDKRQGKLKSREEADELKGELEERRVELQQELNKAQEEGHEALAEATQKQLEAIRERIALQESEVPSRLAAVEAEERRAAALAASVDAEKKVLELYNASSAERRAQEISGMELGAQEGELLRDMGFSSFAQIQEGIEEVFRRVSLGQATEAEVERMRELLELRKRVEAVRVKMAEAERKEAEELAAKEKERLETERQARENYAARRLTYNRNREQAEHERLDIGAQEKGLREEAVRFGVVGDVSPESIRARLDALAEAGAKSNEREIAALERLLESWDKLTERKEAYAKLRGQNAAELRISALEAAGNQAAADKLREQLAVSRRVQELQAAGASEDEAKRQAEAESRVRQAQALQEKIQNRRVEWLQGSQAAVGGGGLSMRLGGGQLAESKRHTKLMQEILMFMKSSANKQQAAGALLA